MAILVTTSRRTNQRVRRFAKELSWVIPFSFKINRGHMSLNDLRDYMYRRGYSRLIVVYSRGGNPNKLMFLTPDIGKFNIVMELEIKSLVLQLDKGVKNIVNELEIIYNGGDKGTYNMLREFIGEHIYDPAREDGIFGKMVISSTDDDYTVLKITDDKDNEIYPRIVVRRIDHHGRI